MSLSRRHFFYGSLLAGAVPAAGFGSTPSLKSLGLQIPQREAEYRRYRLGRPGRGRHPAAAPTENIVALCDVDDKRAARDVRAAFPRRRSIKISGRCSIRKATTSTR